MEQLLRVLFYFTRAISRKLYVRSIALFVTITLTACQTTETHDPTPVSSDFTKHPFHSVEQFRNDNFVNVHDPNQCKEIESLGAGELIQPNIIDRGILCLLTHKISNFEAQEIADAAEIAYQKVADFLEIKFPRKFTIIVREESSEKYPRAKSALGRIIVPYSSFKRRIEDGILIHEITHSLMGRSGPYIKNVDSDANVGARYNWYSSRLLDEGLASFLAVKLAVGGWGTKYNAHLLTLRHLLDKIKDGQLKVLHKNQELFRIHGEINTYTKVGIRYIFASSFIRYLIENGGISRLLQIYRGKDITQLQDDWVAYLDEDYNRLDDTLLRGRTIFNVSRTSDILVCRRMGIDDNFVREGIRRTLNKEKCQVILNSLSSS